MEDLGLARGTVKLTTHKNSWCQSYINESRLVRSILGVAASSIQHVGSTSIPGIMAKPILDIAIRVDSLSIVESWIELLNKIGYSYKGFEANMPQRRFFTKGPEDSREAYLHIVDDEEFKKMISFRDRLIANQQLAGEYSDLKLRLAGANENDRKQYTQLKNKFITNVLNG